MNERFPGYNVLAKRYTLSWNEPTRRAIDKRLAVPAGPRFFDENEWKTLVALCDRILPQPKNRSPVPLAAYVDEKMFANESEGYRFAEMPPQREAWKTALAALDFSAREKRGAPFHQLPPAEQIELLKQMQRGELTGELWRGMPSGHFFSQRVLHDVVDAYYAHPTAWNEIGWAGPASPRGYVRLDKNKRDPWEASEAHPGVEEITREKNRRVL